MTEIKPRTNKAFLPDLSLMVCTMADTITAVKPYVRISMCGGG